MNRTKIFLSVAFAFFFIVALGFSDMASADSGAASVEDKCAVYTSPRAKSLCEQNQRSISRMKDAKEKRRARFQDTRPKTNLQRFKDQQAEQAAEEAAAAAEAEGVTESGEEVIDGTDENTESIAIDSDEEENTVPKDGSDEAKAIEDTLKDAVKSAQ